MLDLGQNPKQPPEVIIGGDKTLHFQAIQEVEDDCGNVCCKPLDISAATEIEVVFQNLDLTYLRKKLTTSGVAIVNGPFGDFDVLLLKAETALWAPSPAGGLSSCQATITIAGKDTIINFPDSFLASLKQFPSS